MAGGDVFMKIREGFLQTKVGGQAYVLPYGQNIADHCDGIALNDTGEILWRGLEEGCDKNELTELLKTEYGLGDEMDDQLSRDVEQFQNRLVRMGILLEEREEFHGWEPQFFHIGAITAAYKGPEVIFERFFRKFAVDAGDGKADLTIQIVCLPPIHHKNGRVLLRSDGVLLMGVGEEYLFLFPGFPALREMRVKRDGSCAELNCDHDLIEQYAEDIFHAIRFAALVAAGERGFFFLHSASFLYRGRAWLFSGRSGTGKSTHTNLWRDAYGVELLNGDLNMLGIDGGEAVVYGQPWCGTSGICTEKAYPLGGITFLRQAPENICEEPAASEKILAIVQRMISPAWERQMLERNIAFAKKVEACCPVWRLHCRADREAVEVMKGAVDNIC